MTAVLALSVLLIVASNGMSQPTIRLIAGSSLVEAFRNDGIFTEKWVMDNDKLVVQDGAVMSTQHQVLFPTGVGPIRIITRAQYANRQGAWFDPMSGQEISIWGVDSITRAWIAETNQIPLVKLGIMSPLTGHVGRRVIFHGKYTKHVHLQKSLFEIDNTSGDVGYIITFQYASPIGGGVQVFPKISKIVLPGAKVKFSPSLAEGSQSVGRSVEWMTYIKAEGVVIPLER